MLRWLITDGGRKLGQISVCHFPQAKLKSGLSRSDVLCQCGNLSQIMWGLGNPSINFHIKWFCWTKVHSKEKKTADASLAKTLIYCTIFVTDPTERGCPLFLHASEAWNIGNIFTDTKKVHSLHFFNVKPEQERLFIFNINLHLVANI